MVCEYQLQMTQRAEADLDEIVGYIRNELENETAAKAILGDIVKCMERLCVFPESGSLVLADYLPGVRMRRKIVGNYILYYRVLKEQGVVRILRIVYGRRDMDEVLRKIDS